MANRAAPLTVITTILPSGERLPCLVYTDTWVPARVATRWAVKYRRFRAAESTLTNNLRTVGRIYEWAATVPRLSIAGARVRDLDDYLVQGGLLDARQLDSLMLFLRVRGEPAIAGVIARGDDTKTTSSPSRPAGTVSAATYNTALDVLSDFLSWAIDPTNRGGMVGHDMSVLATERTLLREQIAWHRITGARSERLTPLSQDEIVRVREAVGPLPSGRFRRGDHRGRGGPLRLRNWLMMELALTLGFRRAEICKLQLGDLPSGSSDLIAVCRRASDPNDPRRPEPNVKSLARAMPSERWLLDALDHYVTAPPPIGRCPRKGQRYVFTTTSGAPVSLYGAEQIMRTIRRQSAVPVTWHRLRHTWAEATRRALAATAATEALARDLFEYLGGWSPGSGMVDPYTSQMRATMAQASLRALITARYAAPASAVAPSTPDVDEMR